MSFLFFISLIGGIHGNANFNYDPRLMNGEIYTDPKSNKDRTLTLHIHMRDGENVENLKSPNLNTSITTSIQKSEYNVNEDMGMQRRQMPCDDVECYNGICLQGISGNTPICECYEGFTGSKCDRLKLECNEHKYKCQGGKCENHHGTHVCRCDNDRVGLNCRDETVLNPCRRNSQISDVHTIRGFGQLMPHIFVHCLANDTFIARKCPQNLFWDQQAETCTREQAEVPIGSCASYPCANGGKCLNVDNNNYACICSPGFYGKDCTRKIDLCENNPCISGKCTSWNGGYTCACADKVFDKCCCNGVVNRCKRNGIDFYAHNETSFVHCGPSGEAYLKSCPSGLIWQNNIKTCIRPDSFAHYTNVWDHSYRSDNSKISHNPIDQHYGNMEYPLMNSRQPMKANKPKESNFKNTILDVSNVEHDKDYIRKDNSVVRTDKKSMQSKDDPEYYDRKQPDNEIVINIPLVKSSYDENNLGNRDNYFQNNIGPRTDGNKVNVNDDNSKYYSNREEQHIEIPNSVPLTKSLHIDNNVERQNNYPQNNIESRTNETPMKVDVTDDNSRYYSNRNQQNNKMSINVPLIKSSFIENNLENEYNYPQNNIRLRTNETPMKVDVNDDNSRYYSNRENSEVPNSVPLVKSSYIDNVEREHTHPEKNINTDNSQPNNVPLVKSSYIDTVGRERIHPEININADDLQYYSSREELPNNVPLEKCSYIDNVGRERIHPEMYTNADNSQYYSSREGLPNNVPLEKCSYIDNFGRENIHPKININADDSQYYSSREERPNNVPLVKSSYIDNVGREHIHPKININADNPQYYSSRENQHSEVQNNVPLVKSSYINNVGREHIHPEKNVNADNSQYYSSREEPHSEVQKNIPLLKSSYIDNNHESVHYSNPQTLHIKPIISSYMDPNIQHHPENALPNFLSNTKNHYTGGRTQFINAPSQQPEIEQSNLRVLPTINTMIDVDASKMVSPYMKEKNHNSPSMNYNLVPKKAEVSQLSANSDPYRHQTFNNQYNQQNAPRIPNIDPINFVMDKSQIMAQSQYDNIPYNPRVSQNAYQSMNRQLIPKNNDADSNIPRFSDVKPDFTIPKYSIIDKQPSHFDNINIPNSVSYVPNFNKFENTEQQRPMQNYQIHSESNKLRDQKTFIADQLKNDRNDVNSNHALFRRYADDDIIPAEEGFQSVQIATAPITEQETTHNIIPVKFLEYHY